MGNNGDDFVKVKRGRSSSLNDADIVKIKGKNVKEDDEDIDEYDEENERNSNDVLEDDEENEDGDEDPHGTDEENEKGHEDPQDTDETQKEHMKKQHSRRRISFGHSLVEGKMKHGMEDYVVAKRKEVDGHELGLYAIFDGHSGRKVAEFLQGHLFNNILNEPDFWEDPKSAVKRAYKVTDDYIVENVVGSRGGSTAVTAILIDRKKLIVAHVGDSRAVLCRNGKAKQITIDHDPLKEREMVESKGGFVTQGPGNVPRVDGQLAMTRAFGDESLKDHITAEPDISIKTIDEDADAIILASDGIWKVMSSQEAAECIEGLKDGREAAEKLVEEALSRRAQDDASCVVVKFH